MKYPPMPYHTIHPDFVPWMKGTTQHDLRVREATLRRQVQDPEIQNDGFEFAMLYASWKHVSFELELRLEAAEDRRVGLPPFPELVIADRRCCT